MFAVSTNNLYAIEGEVDSRENRGGKSAFRVTFSQLSRANSQLREENRIAFGADFR